MVPFGNGSVRVCLDRPWILSIFKYPIVHSPLNMCLAWQTPAAQPLIHMLTWSWRHGKIQRSRQRAEALSGSIGLRIICCSCPSWLRRITASNKLSLTFWSRQAGNIFSLKCCLLAKFGLEACRASEASPLFFLWKTSEALVICAFKQEKKESNLI